MWDNFNCDPYAQNAMIETVENVAAESGISREEQNALTLLRYQQYQDALMRTLPFIAVSWSHRSMCRILLGAKYWRR